MGADNTFGETNFNPNKMDINKEAITLWDDLLFKSNVPQHGSESREDYLERLEKKKIETILQSYERICRETIDWLDSKDFEKVLDENGDLTKSNADLAKIFTHR